MRSLFLITPLVLGFGPGAFAQEQVAPTSRPPVALTAYYSAEDTLRAVRHLFGQRLKSGLDYVEVGSTILTKAAVTTALRPADVSEGQRIDTNRDWLAGSLLTSYGGLRAQRFGPRRYAQIVAAYQQGEPLPRYVSRRLKPKYFRFLMH